MSYSYSTCYCRECECMDLSDRSRYDNIKAWCSARRTYINPNENACSTYFRYDESRKPVSGCYLTTIICNLLGKGENALELQMMRAFRDGYMLNEPKLYPMLIEYDVVGPKIVNALIHDPLQMTIAKKLYENYITPITEDILLANYDIAIQKYTNMTQKLRNMYNIDSTITKKLDINIKTLGKART